MTPFDQFIAQPIMSGTLAFVVFPLVTITMLWFALSLFRVVLQLKNELDINNDPVGDGLLIFIFIIISLIFLSIAGAALQLSYNFAPSIHIRSINYDELIRYTWHYIIGPVMGFVYNYSGLSWIVHTYNSIHKNKTEWHIEFSFTLMLSLMLIVLGSCIIIASLASAPPFPLIIRQRGH